MNFNQLTNNPKVRKRRAYLKALDRVDSDLESETEPNRPGRTQFSQASSSGLLIDEAKQKRFQRIKDEERARRKQLLKEKYGQDL